ncbi:MAG: hypothetical protein M3P45_10065 [Acidobacteriota bacterium]|nr:hypothetical protein [Acidobacteriota bacterium]
MAWLALHAVFGLCAVTVAGFGCGSWIADALPDSFHRAERCGLSLLGGLGLFSLALFLIGQVSFTRGTIAAALTVAALLAVRPLHFAWRKIERISRTIAGNISVAGSIVFLVLAITAISGIAEMTGDWGKDSVSYHLLGPTVWLREGIVRPVLDNSTTSFPQIPETLFAVLLVAGGDRAPDFSSWLTLVLLLLVSAGLAMRMGSSASQAWWAAAIIVTMPAVYAGSHACFVDGLYAALVLAAARVGFDAKYVKDWALCGIFVGLAMGTKYTGLLALLALIVCFLIALAKPGQFSGAALFKSVGIALVTSLAVAAPFYIRNWIILGCPIYPPPPGYALVCSPRYFPADAISQFHAYIYQRGMGLGHGWLAFAKLPFNLTYHTSNFHGAGGIGLCPLGLAPFGVVALRKNFFARQVALLGFLVTALWFVTQQESRFLIPVYVISAIFSVAGWHYVREHCGNLQRLTAAVIIGVSVLYGLFMIGAGQADNLRAVFSPAYAQARRQREIPYLASFDYLNASPVVQKVLILDRSVPPYYLRKPYVKPVGQWGELTFPGLTTGLAALKQGGELRITHVLDVVSPVSGFQIQDSSPNLTLVLESKGQRIYRFD